LFLEDVKHREKIEINVCMGASVVLVATGWWLAVRSRNETHVAAAIAATYLSVGRFVAT
jgi:hypothetical protein